MKISGHKTRSKFDRYDIVSDKNIKDAAGKVEDYLNGQREALMETRDKVILLKERAKPAKGTKVTNRTETKPK